MTFIFNTEDRTSTRVKYMAVECQQVHSTVSFDRYCVSLSDHWVLELGPRLRPNVATTLTNLRLYCKRLLALPVFFFFFSCLSTYRPPTRMQQSMSVAQLGAHRGRQQVTSPNFSCKC